MQANLRLDKYLVSAGYFTTRARAEDAIKRAAVQIDGKTITKAGFLVTPDLTSDLVKIQDASQSYVSRAALKLAAALDYFAVDVCDKFALDLGASTGGFTQILLQRGVKHVLAVDVGHSQLAPQLRADARVTCLEGVNARYLTKEHLGNRSFNLLVCDVSFISLRLALPPSLRLAEPGSLALMLIKPQFEAGKQALNKTSGVIKDTAMARSIAEDIFLWFNKLPNWVARGLYASPVRGRQGNQEYILFGEKTCGVE